MFWTGDFMLPLSKGLILPIIKSLILPLRTCLMPLFRTAFMLPLMTDWTLPGCTTWRCCLVAILGGTLGGTILSSFFIATQTVHVMNDNNEKVKIL